jgi:hypothetical protein
MNHLEFTYIATLPMTALSEALALPHKPLRMSREGLGISPDLGCSGNIDSNMSMEGLIFTCLTHCKLSAWSHGLCELVQLL